MSREINPLVLWGAGAVGVLVLAFVIWKYVVAAPRSTASATKPTSAAASARMQAIRAAGQGRSQGQRPAQNPSTP